jgi:hypothetical protein
VIHPGLFPPQTSPEPDTPSDPNEVMREQLDFLIDHHDTPTTSRRYLKVLEILMETFK